MLHEAAPFLVALEQSGLGAAIRQSAWAYPAANVGHILALTLFAGSVAAMDDACSARSPRRPRHRSCGRRGAWRRSACC